MEHNKRLIQKILYYIHTLFLYNRFFELVFDNLKYIGREKKHYET